jgi:hypothetical protein
MKKLISIPQITLVVLILVASCNSANPASSSDEIKDNNREAQISFEKDVHDFGKLINGERVTYAFRFTNTGNAPLLITGTRTGCGCTVGDYPKEPIMPGQKGKVGVVFNSSGKKGYQNENIRVFTNTTEEVVTLRIQAEVSER